MPLYATKKEECYEVTKVYDFFQVMGWMGKKLDQDLHDLMFEMISHSDQEGKNDSLHRVYRHWLKEGYGEQTDNTLQTLFDLICEEFEIPQDMEHSLDGKPTTQIVFWVSW